MPNIPTYTDPEQFNEALQACFASGAASGEPPVGLLVGAAGTGKTTLLNAAFTPGAPVTVLSPDAKSNHEFALPCIEAGADPQLLVIDHFEGWRGGSLREGLKAIRHAMAQGQGPAGLLLVARSERSLKPFQDVLPAVIPGLLFEGSDATGVFTLEPHTL